MKYTVDQEAFKNKVFDSYFSSKTRLVLLVFCHSMDSKNSVSCGDEGINLLIKLSRLDKKKVMTALDEAVMAGFIVLDKSALRYMAVIPK